MAIIRTAVQRQLLHLTGYAATHFSLPLSDPEHRCQLISQSLGKAHTFLSVPWLGPAFDHWNQPREESERESEGGSERGETVGRVMGGA